MLNDDRTFFEKLTGIYPEDAGKENTSSTDIPPLSNPAEEQSMNEHATIAEQSHESPADKDKDEGQLTVDVFQTPTHIVVQAPMAGVKPDDIDVSINRDMITIRGRREQKQETETHNYYYREVFWGAFSRSVLLPEEVDSDHTEASFKAGLLTIRMPKIDREGQRVKIEAKEI